MVEQALDQNITSRYYFQIPLKVALLPIQMCTKLLALHGENFVDFGFRDFENWIFSCTLMLGNFGLWAFFRKSLKRSPGLLYNAKTIIAKFH